MSVSARQHDKDVVRDAAAGRWLFILAGLGLPSEFLEQTTEGPCPKCEGNTRAKVFGDVDEVGGVFCSHCHDHAKDGFGTLTWFFGWKFSEAVNRVGEFLQLDPVTDHGKASGNSKPAEKKSTRKSRLTKKEKETRATIEDSQGYWKTWLQGPIGPAETDKGRARKREMELRDYAANKPGIDADYLVASKVRVMYIKRHGWCVVFVGLTSDRLVTGTQIVRVDGELVKISDTVSNKSQNIKDSKDGWFCPNGYQAMLDAKMVIKCEGPADALAIQPFLPAGTVAVTNLCGAGSWPGHDVDWLRSKELVFTLYDADIPGQEGERKFGQGMLKLGVRSASIRLPYEIEDDHGKDARDWVDGVGTAEEFQKMIDEATPVEFPVDKPSVKPVIVRDPTPSSNVFPVINAFPGTEDEPPEPLPLSVISKRLNDTTGGWPKSCAGTLFDYNHAADQLVTINKTPQLFAWAGRATEAAGIPPCFHRMTGCHTKEEFHAHLIETQERYESIELIPHEPLVQGIFYAHRELIAEDENVRM